MDRLGALSTPVLAHHWPVLEQRDWWERTGSPPPAAPGQELFGPGGREKEEADVSPSETLQSSQEQQTSARWQGPKASLLPATLSN